MSESKQQPGAAHVLSAEAGQRTRLVLFPVNAGGRLKPSVRPSHEAVPKSGRERLDVN